MKKIISLAVLLCALASSALAAAPETALQALTLGNSKYVLEKSLGAAPLAMVVVDPAVSVDPAVLFDQKAGKVAVIKAGAPFGPETGLTVQDKDIIAPVILLLGTDVDAIWAVYANTVKASPELIHAVLKGKVAVQGALVDAKTGAVQLLGAHPEVQTLVGQYLLGIKPEAAPAEKAEEAAAPAEEAPAAKAEKAAPAPKAEKAEAGHEAPKAEAAAESGGSGFMMIILFVIALVGVVVLLDKVVLKD